MKKLLLFAGALMITLHTFAQSQITDLEIDVSEINKTNTSKTRAQGWYNYAEALDELDGNNNKVTFYINYLFPDTLPFTNVNDSRRPSRHSMGQVLDPTSGFFDATANQGPGLLSNQGYRIDMIEIPYAYYRVNASTNPDTLLIQTYKQNALTLVPSGFNEGIPYARQNYTYQTNLGNTHHRIDTVLLTANHVSPWNGGASIELPLNILVGAGEKVAMTMSYRPGHSYQLDDVIQLDHPNANVNAFINFWAYDENKTIEAGIYNHAQIVPTSVRYNFNAQGWNGRYIPGVAYLNGYFQTDVWFQLTSFVGIEKSYSNTKATIAPNPVATGANARINIETEKPGIISVVVTDMMGRQVLNTKVSAGSGKQQVELKTGELVAGAYFVTLKKDGNLISATKLVVAK